jgi:ABC-type multidrug transport system fused ATPase/permease subunit
MVGEPQRTPEEQRHALEESGHALDVRAVVRLALRTLPYLRPAFAELRPLLWVFLPLLILSLPMGMLGADLFLNRMLNAQPLTDFEAWLLSVDPAEFVAVEALSVGARQLIRDRLVIGTFGLALVLSPIAFWAAYKILLIRQRINQILRVEMVSNMQAMSMRFHAGSRVGDSIYRTYQDSAMVTSMMGMLVRPIGPIFAAIMGFFIAFIYDWRLPILCAVLYIIAYAIARYYTPILRRAFREARERNSGLTSRIQETLSGIKVVKANGAEAMEQQRFEEASLGAFEGAYDARSRLALLGIVAFVVSALPPMLTATAASVLASDGAPIAAGWALAFVGFSVWNLGAYANVMGRVGSWSRAARRLLWMWGQTQDMAVGMERAFSQVDMRPEVADAEDAELLPPFAKSVVFRNVSFGYDPEHPVLESVDLTARAGTITALIGPTGSGKSTLVSLLLRLFDPDSGSIEIDGHDLRSIGLDSLRSNVSIALQENLLFATTIAENIRYAVPSASDEQVREAARVACAETFIEEQPQGYDTMLGERGARLSTGQRQRLSIARAVIKNAPVLVLDEPTASLDAETELEVMQRLADWGRGRAIVIVTHRLSTIRRADQIVYLRDGRVVEAGSHDELIAQKDGAYRNFVELERTAGRVQESKAESDDARGAAS